MARIKVTFLSILAEIVGKKEYSFKIEENFAIKDLLAFLINKFGVNFKNYFFESSDLLKKYIIIGLNGKDIRQYEGVDTKINNGDHISFLPAIAGG